MEKRNNLREALASGRQKGYHGDKGGETMTKKKKLALLKKGAKLLEPVLREEAALIPAAGRVIGKKGSESVALALPLQQIKKYGLLAGGGLLGISLLGSAARTASYRMAVSRELKKQLKPIHEKLDKLEKENAELKAELEKERKKNR